jgi:putative DNA primase/helicase
MQNNNKPFHESVAEKLIEQLRRGTAPWQKPWEPGAAGANMPINPTTGKRYKGINAIHLMSQGRQDQRWLTYKQAAAVDAQVRKGEKGTLIQYWKFTEEQVKLDAAGQRIVDASGRPATEKVHLERPRVFFATVFNAEQIDGMPPQEPRKEQTWNAVERAEQILRVSGASMVHGEHDRAFYRPATDSIHLPDKSRFATADNYYATALHELGHWTGHQARLNRDMIHPFGSEGYAKEELRAEIASMILGDELGIGHDPAQHVAYVGSWITLLENDPLEIFRAAAAAEKIQAYVLGLDQTQHQEQDNSNLIAATAGQTAQKRVIAEGADMAMPKLIDAEMTDETRVEIWMRERIEQGNLAHALDNASLAEMHRMHELLRAMVPLNVENQFWQRHVLPPEPESLVKNIDSMRELLETRTVDAHVAATRLAMLTKATLGKEHAEESASFEHETRTALGFLLPKDWNGSVHVCGNVTVEVDGKLIAASALEKGLTPESWGIYAEQEDGTQAWLADRPSESLADALAERLSLIDASSTINELEKASKLARLHEERVRRDPGSTDEQISAASKALKDAEFLATTNDADLQRRIKQEESELLEHISTSSNQKRLISVPYKQKDEAKALGAKWDRQTGSWFVPDGVDPAPFEKWVPRARDLAETIRVPKSDDPRQYLAVPYVERVEAKAAGAEWDKTAKSWYAGPGADMPKLDKWMPHKVRVQQAPAMPPRDEFAEALASIGCVISGEHPIMDGKKHRISVEGEKFSKNSGAGFYVGHLDDHPAGYMKNNKTGAELTWKSKGYTLNAEQKARMMAEAAAKLGQREAELVRRQDQAALRVARQMDKLIPVLQPTPYMLVKGIEPHAGAYTDKDGKKTYLPAMDVEGKQWTMQYIDDSGNKRFAKDSKKKGCFHVVGGVEALANVPTLVISEGYATAASLKQSLGFATVCAFDSGNLVAVAQALHRRFPHKPLVIAGDDDRHLEITQGSNPGRSKAEEAAKLVSGKLLLPIFAPGENNYPAGLEPVTPAKYRAHQKGGDVLSAEQMLALNQMKQFTDFNDLATKSALGQEGLDRQVQAMVRAATVMRSLAHIEWHLQDRDIDAVTVAEQPLIDQSVKTKRVRAAKLARL